MNVIWSLDAREPPWILLMLGINTVYFLNFFYLMKRAIIECSWHCQFVYLSRKLIR